MFTNPNQVQRGFAALMAVIVISAMLVSQVFVVAQGGLSVRLDVLSAEQKTISKTLASSCVEVAIIKLNKNYFYLTTAGGEVVPVGSKNCILKKIEHGIEGASREKKVIVYTQGQSGGSFTNLVTVLEMHNPRHFSEFYKSTISIMSQAEFGESAL
jgi:hypothetical protein